MLEAIKRKRQVKALTLEMLRLPPPSRLPNKIFKVAMENDSAAVSDIADVITADRESYVADDKTFCVYLAKDESIIQKHAEISGFPATKITPVSKMIDPTTEKAN